MLAMSFPSLIFIIFVLLSACSTGGNYAPVADINNGARVGDETYVVSRGETLYSIAWARNLEFRGLASTNNIASPYTIYPGQVLRLSDQNKPTESRTKVSPSSSPPASSSRQKASAKAKPVTTPSRPQGVTPKLDKSQYPYRWQWPANGKLIRRYRASGSVHKGIDLQGKLGEPVYAANSGIVVYAGSGLKGYGNLLIVKHNEYYLSAYGHNSKLLVKEGQKVRSGQQIAQIGDTGTNEVKLHFEIRRDGKPVDPLTLLPKK
jgi:lipoprotein NlpD